LLGLNKFVSGYFRSWRLVDGLLNAAPPQEAPRFFEVHWRPASDSWGGVEAHKMNHIATIAEVTAADLARERRLNETILEGDIRIDIAHYLKAFDEFYADDVVIVENALAVPLRGKAENRARLESFIFVRSRAEVPAKCDNINRQ